MEVKIQIPDNCELIKDGDTYIVKEKNDKPRSWEEFCERYPVKKGESFIATINNIHTANYNGKDRYLKNWCVSKEEAEAFLALMQLRQLRKAWVDDWKQPKHETIAAITYSIDEGKIVVTHGTFLSNKILSFPTQLMAYDFLGCFKDLCETAKILL